MRDLLTGVPATVLIPDEQFRLWSRDCAACQTTTNRKDEA